MDKILKEITDSTLNELLNQHIIMPSQYYKTFDKHSKDRDMYIYDEEFEHSLTDIIDKEFERINQYMSQTVESVDDLNNITNSAQEAIINKDAQQLMKVNQQVKKLKNTIESLQNEIFKDDLTKLYNRKYLIHKMVNEESKFKNDGFVVLIDINNFRKINQKYGELIADNVLIYSINYILKKLAKEDIETKCIRYAGDKFLFFFKKEKQQQLTELFDNIRLGLLNSTVKSKSGHIITISFSYGSTLYGTSDNLQNVLLILDDLVKEDKFLLLENGNKQETND